MNFGWPSPMNMIVYGSNRHLWNEGKRKGFLFVAYRSVNTHKSLEAPASKRSVGGGQFTKNTMLMEPSKNFSNFSASFIVSLEKAAQML
ncbi:hypothetical protein P9762_13235, partial [Geobacillus stearothermophilus]|uniref:hypothetical protein n=1 Tax=Geobacillus stearothermophilus TaxID=1422 RepID=UPI002E1B2423|nr:hypothetical protein [Geobacillus stearothermophilus]